MIPDVAADALCAVLMCYEMLGFMCVCLAIFAMFPVLIDWLGSVLSEGKDGR